MMQLMQVTYGLATAAQISFFSYIYRLVPQDEYQRVVRQQKTDFTFLDKSCNYHPSIPTNRLALPGDRPSLAMLLLVFWVLCHPFNPLLKPTLWHNTQM